MEISCSRKVDCPKEREEIWQFYTAMLSSLNDLSPLSQTLTRRQVMAWLISSRAAKYVAREKGEIVGLAVVSSDLRHDPLISRPYFQKHFPRQRVYHCPAIAFHPKWRTGAGRQLLAQLFAGLPKGSVALFFHSEMENPLIPKFAQLATKGKFIVEKVDAMACCVCIPV